ncbi:transcriptional regulator FeaR [Metapseudomonas otitidis]|uniref:transcriptional regulator FeaR n=1 Tax=Metapseudomonas otitidis TaxID=319939 RepID=UPI0013F5EED3|nr:transcriptional regulator FeaR [Pseudomonas otitidis]
MTNSPDRAWEQALQDSCGPFQVAWRRPYARGIGYIRGRATQGIGVHDIHTDAGSIHKQRQSVDWADDPHCFLVLQQRGGCHMNLQAQRLELQPGSLVLMDPAGDCSIEPAGLIQHLSITLDRQLVTQALRHTRHYSGRLYTESTTGRALLRWIQLLATPEHNGFGQEEGLAIQESLIALLTPCLKGDTTDTKGAVLLAEPTLRLHAESLVKEFIQLPELCPAFIAQRLGVSQRSLYRTFEQGGSSLCEMIKATRIARSADDLANPRQAHQSITSISMRWGFSDAAYFCRVFKQHFGMSPSEYRRNAIAPSVP